MIRDFLEQLKWQLRAHLYETNPLTAEPSVNEEITETLGRYMKRRRNTGLLFLNEGPVGPQSEDSALWEKLRRFLYERAKSNLAALESLDELFEEAFYTLSEVSKDKESVALCRKWTVAEIEELEEPDLGDDY
jgi:hypothetical protein